MHIHYIEAENFKGRSFAHDLAPLTLIVGDNFDGKTAIAEAVGIGLIGYTPLLGKRNMDTFKLATGSKMRIRMAAEREGLEHSKDDFEHTWRQSETGIKYEKKVPFETPPILLDLREYLYETTAAERVAAIFGKIDMSKFDDGAVRDRLAKLEALPAKVAEPIIQKLLADFDRSVESRQKRQVSVQSWIQSLIDDWQERRKRADKEAQLASGAIVAARRAVEIIPGLPKDRGAELSEARAKLATVQREIGAVEAKCSTWNKSKARREQIAAELVGWKPTAELAWLGGKRSDLVQEASKLEKAIIAHKSVSERLRADCEARRGDFRAAQEKLTVLKRQAANAASEIIAIEAKDCCPFCHAKAKGWRDRVIDELTGRKAMIEAQAKPAEAALAKAEAEGKDLRAKFDKAEAADAENAKRHADLARLQAQASLQRELEALGGGDPPDESKLESLKGQMDGLLKQIAEAQEETDAWKSRKAFKEQADAKEAESVKAQCEAGLLKAAVAALIETQREMVAAAFEKLLKKSRWFTDGILRSPLCYKDGELGRMAGDTFVHHQAFSGTEQLLAYAGLSVALAQEAPIKIVRLDEMGRLTAANKRLVCERLRELIELGRIDQAIIIDADVRDYGDLATWPKTKVIKV